MQKIIIADTSCLILLDKIKELNILKLLFGKVYITRNIALEFNQPIPEWIKIQNPMNKNYQKSLLKYVDDDEASAIALAVEKADSLLILDDRKARKLADNLKLNYTGTIGVLIEAKQSGCFKSIKPILTKIKRTNFHLSEELEAEIIEKSGE